MTLDARIEGLMTKKDSRWAWANYLPTVRDLIAEQGCQNVIEIGGGRDPAMTKSQIDALGIDYTSSDIMASELALAPEWVNTAHFDVQTADKSIISPFEDQYDLAFSRMVMEHVESYERAYSNIYDILKPGGISIAFHPVYYALPFVINNVLPEHVSQKLLATVFPNRTVSDIPKFPAHYSGCKISPKVRRTLSHIGFSKVWQVPFYGHTYYGKFPVVREVHTAVTNAIARMDMTMLSTFSYTVLQK